jgi:zinc transporter 1/2/3
MMFSNDCVGELEYEGVTSAIVMAGIFLSFLVEYVGHRIVQAKIRSEAALGTQERSKALISSEVVSITVMEAGILFHSLCKLPSSFSDIPSTNISLVIGLTLVVAGDSFFLTLFVVILFHQVFEGLALGTRIATIGTRDDPELHPVESGGVLGDERKSAQAESSSETSETVPVGLSMKKKLLLASCFAFITPIGMAIGIGVLKQFNGNDKSTLIAIGTLDALSAGMLVWVGLVEMWAADWVTGSHGRKAELADANVITTCVAFFGLISGLVLMSVLGKWA